MNSHLHAHPFSSQMKAKYSQWKAIMGLSSCRVWPLHTNFFWRLFRNLNTWLEPLSLVLRRADPTMPTHKVFVLVTLMMTGHNCVKLEDYSMLLYSDKGLYVLCTGILLDYFHSFSNWEIWICIYANWSLKSDVKIMTMQPCKKIKNNKKAKVILIR